MGNYLSRNICESRYNVTMNCAINWTDARNTTFDGLGGITKGSFEGDGDIAGIGIVGTFLAVTSLALFLSFVSICLRMWQHDIFPFICSRKTKNLDHDRDEKIPRRSIQPSVADMFESVVLVCSDTQIFAGAAFAITLRYFRGCVITAYHYNIVANMMLLTCATHLMAITVVREYWKYPWLAVLRVGLKISVFLFTGLLLAHQNAPGLVNYQDGKQVAILFPSRVPSPSEEDSYYFLAAACFQSEKSRLIGLLKQSAEDWGQTLKHSTPGNHIEGWNKYLVILFWFILSSLAEIGLFIRRGRNEGAKYRKKLIDWFWGVLLRSRCCGGKRSSGHDQDTDASPDPETSDKKVKDRVRKTGHYILTIYAFGGIGICVWTVSVQGAYIMSLRKWVHRSKWMENDVYGNNHENDATSFGQLVPICTSALVLFTFLQEWSTWWSNRREAKHRLELKKRNHRLTEDNLELKGRLGDVESDPSVQTGSTIVSNGQDPPKLDSTVTQTSVPPTPGLGFNTPIPYPASPLSQSPIPPTPGLELNTLVPYPASPSSQSPLPTLYSPQGSPQHFVPSQSPLHASTTALHGQHQHHHYSMYQPPQQQGDMQPPTGPYTLPLLPQSQQQGTSPPHPIPHSFTPGSYGQGAGTSQPQPAPQNLSSSPPPQSPPANTENSFVVDSTEPSRPTFTSELPPHQKPASDKLAPEELASEKPASELPTLEIPTSQELTSNKPASPKSPTRKPVTPPNEGKDK